MSTDRDRRHRRQSVTHRGGTLYPGDWSKWEWIPEENKWRKERAISKNEVEAVYKAYDEVDPQKTPRPATILPSVPRNDPVSSFSTVPQSTGPYTNEDEYTTQNDPLFSLSGSLAGMSMKLTPPPPLNSVPEPEAHVVTIDPSTKEETLDRNYRVEEAWKFKFGKVFKVFWSEPGGMTKGARGGTEYSEKVGLYGESVMQKVRRFVVISPMKGHCICLPIMTYQGQATTKRGVQSGDHAIIYTSQPALLRGEGNLAKAPIKMIPYSVQHKLEPASRLNYAKVYTIEYNVKVCFIGKIAEESEWKLVAAYNDVHPPLRPRGAQRSLSSAGSSGGYAPTLAPRDRSPGFPPWTSRTSGPPPSSLVSSQMPQYAPGQSSSSYYTAPLNRYNDGYSESGATDYQPQPQPTTQRQVFPSNVAVARYNPVETSNYQYHQPATFYSQNPYPPSAGHYPPPQDSYYAQPQNTQQSQYPFQGNAGPSYQSDQYRDTPSRDSFGARPPRRDDNDDLYDP